MADRVDFEQAGVFRRERFQSRLRLCGDQQQRRMFAGPERRGRQDLVLRRFAGLENRVGIGPAEAERVYSCIEVTPRRGRCQRLDLNGHFEMQRFKIDRRVPRLEMKVRGDEAMFQDECRFDHPGDPGGGFEMADVRFHRTHQEWSARCPPAAESISDRPCLDRIAHRGSGAVRFDIDEIGRLDAGGLHRLADE